MGDAPQYVVDTVTEAGGSLSAEGRLRFPVALVEDAIAGMRRDAILYGRGSAEPLDLSGETVYFGSGGAATEILDLDSGTYRPSTLTDLYDAARVVDAMEHIDFFSRSMIARDVEGADVLDVNTAYVCLAGTSKHVSTSASEAAHVKSIAVMCDALSHGPFAKAPFLSLNVNHAVPPFKPARRVPLLFQPHWHSLSPKPWRGWCMYGSSTLTARRFLDRDHSLLICGRVP